jgi:hypothetical protein
MIQVDIEKYFRPRGIDVSYNTLGGEESLYRAYVNQFQTIVDNTKMGMSHHVKHHCYNQLYQIEPRQKLTGFENYKDIDKSFRERARKEISLIDWVDSIDILKSENKLVTGMSYKDQLKAKVTKFNRPLMYLSGGGDSELVALAMIDASVKFTPVIFHYIDKQDNILNFNDIKYAYKFCKTHFLNPIIKTIDIEQLWNEEWFFQKAVELQTISPHIMTHYHMVEIMEKEFPGVSHVFGGEVRFQSSITDEFGEKVNLIKLGKQGLPGNGGSYTNSPGLWGNAIIGYQSEPSFGGGNGYNYSVFMNGIGNIGTWFTNTYSPNFLENRSQYTMRFRSTCNSISGTNPGNATFYRWNVFNPGFNGWNNNSPGSTVTYWWRDNGSFPTSAMPGGPWVHADASTSNASIIGNFTLEYSSNGPATFPTSPTLSATFTLSAISNNP